MECIVNQIALGDKLANNRRSKPTVKRWMLKFCIANRDCLPCAERLARMVATAKAAEIVRAGRSEDEVEAGVAERRTEALALAKAHETGDFRYGTGTMMSATRNPKSVAKALQAAGYTPREASRILGDLMAETAAERARRNAERGCADLMIGNAPRYNGQSGFSLDEVAEHISARGNDNSDSEQTRVHDHANMGLAWRTVTDRHGRKCLISIECHLGRTRHGAERAGAIVARLNWDGAEQLRVRDWLGLIDLGLMSPGKLRDLIHEAAHTVEGFSAPEFLSIWSKTSGTSDQERHAVQTPNYAAETLQMRA